MDNSNHRSDNSVSVVIPIHNEKSFLSISVNNLVNELKKLNLDYFEIILSENGSIDGTFDEAKCLSLQLQNIKIASHSFANYGLALKLGIKRAICNKIVLFNIDFWDIGFLKESLNLLGEFDCVIGSKVLCRSSDKRPLFRKLITKTFNIFLNVFFGYKGTDTHGIKAFRTDKIMPLVERCLSDKEVFDTELLIRAQREKLSIKEIPVVVEEKRPTRYIFLKDY